MAPPSSVTLAPLLAAAAARCRVRKGEAAEVPALLSLPLFASTKYVAPPAVAVAVAAVVVLVLVVPVVKGGGGGQPLSPSAALMRSAWRGGRSTF